MDEHLGNQLVIIGSVMYSSFIHFHILIKLREELFICYQNTPLLIFLYIDDTMAINIETLTIISNYNHATTKLAFHSNETS